MFFHILSRVATSYPIEPDGEQFPACLPLLGYQTNLSHPHVYDTTLSRAQKMTAWLSQSEPMFQQEPTQIAPSKLKPTDRDFVNKHSFFYLKALKIHIIPPYLFL